MQRRNFLTSLASSTLVAGSTFGDEPTKPRIKIGQIGVGHAHASKLAVYRKSADYEVVGIVEPDESLRKRAEITTTYKDLKWMTRDNS